MSSTPNWSACSACAASAPTSPAPSPTNSPSTTRCGPDLDVEFGIDQHHLVSPWAAAGSSALAFTIGALLPLIAILVPPESARIAVAFVAVLVGLLITGVLSASVGRSRRVVAVVRLVVGGALAMAVTFGIGSLLN